MESKMTEELSNFWRGSEEGVKKCKQYKMEKRDRTQKSLEK